MSYQESPAVEVHGYFLEANGLSAMATGLLRACDAAKIPALPVLIRDSRIEGYAPRAAVPAVAPELARLPIQIDATTPELLNRRVALGEAGEPALRIGLWAWEVIDWLPPGWLPGLDHVREIWTLSEHCAQALRRVSRVPVHVIGLPVVAPPALATPRHELGLPGGFMFLASFDLASSLDRKNPLGVIEAFSAAFPSGGASLVLKTVSGDFLPERLEQVTRAASRHPNIHLIEGRLPKAQHDALLAACDCYVSLHRSEGLGLGMAEAMACARPVIASGYSGNLDFMNDTIGHLVPVTPVPVPGGDPVYAGGTWGEPDLGRAAALMRQVFEQPDESRALGLAAADAVRHTLAPEVVGERVRARLAALSEGVSLPPPDPLSDALTQLLARQRVDGEAAARAPVAIASLARREHDEHFALYRGATGGFRHRHDPIAGVVQTYDCSGPSPSPYVEFERAFRGAESLIHERQRYYLPFLAGHAPVLDLGCGRAEMLDLLAEQGIPAQGVDADQGMVAQARAKGHDVIRADALAELESRAAESLGAVFCSHVIEHVSGSAIERLLRGALRALRPGGLLLLETPNPYFAFWLRNFWIDPTHRHLVFPEALLTLCAGVGFADVLHTHPNGSGHVEVDRFAQPDMTVIATKANR